MASIDLSGHINKSEKEEEREETSGEYFQLAGDSSDSSQQFSSNLLNSNSNNNSKMDGLMSKKRPDLPDDLACFLQQQKQRQARLETTMRSFPANMEGEMEKQELANKKKRTTHEDPLSHRIIEKRRRDRMNNCLADLSRLIPSSYLKKGRGRIEKTEIIEMAIKHMKHLQSHPCNKPEGCELAQEIETGLSKSNSVESFRVGYHECLTESMHFLVEKEGLYSGNSFCVRLMAHLQKHYDRLGRASTSEIHSTVGRTWSGQNLPAENEKNRSCERSKVGVKSEYGFGSEESGYSSLKPDDDSVVNMARIESDRRFDQRNRSYSPEPHLREENEKYHHYTEPNDKPSDLSIHPESNENYSNLPEDHSTANLYKFKSNIRQRFDSMQDTDVEYPPVKRHRRNSVSSEKDLDINEDLETASTINRPYSPPPQVPSSYDSFSHRSTHARLLAQPSRQSPFSSKGDPSKPLIHHSSEDSEPIFNNQNIKECMSPVPYSQGGQNLSLPKTTGKALPIFALNTKGTYYIPLSIDSSVITPFLNLFAEDNSGPLHPVTISVNFSGPRASAPSLPDRDQEWRQPRGGVIQKPSVIKHWRDAP